MDVTKLLFSGFIGLVALSSSHTGAQEPAAAPFEQFRAGLEQAVAQRDWSWFERHLTEGEFLSSLGPFSGPEELVEMWEPQKPDGAFWPELDLILAVSSLSAGVYGTADCAGPTPRFGEEESLRLFGEDLEYEDLLQKDLYFLAGNAVPLRSAPGIDARVVAVVSNEWVIVIGNARSLMQNRTDWVQVRTSFEREGYVDGFLLRSLVSSRLCYALEDGAWRITGFVDGE